MVSIHPAAEYPVHFLGDLGGLFLKLRHHPSLECPGRTVN